MRQVKPAAKVEANFRKRMGMLWDEVLTPVTERIKQAIQSGADLEHIASLIQDALRQSETIYNMRVDEIVTLWSLSLETSTRRIFEQSLRQSLGVDTRAVLDDPAIKGNLQLARIEAAKLVTDVTKQQIGLIAKAVADNSYGKLPDGVSLMDRIQQIEKMPKQRAKLIARDQTSKMTAKLNQIRQQSIGVEIYVWKNVRDNRVVGNPSGLYPIGNDKHGNHWIMEGLYCRWDDPTVYSTDKGKTWKKRIPEMPKNHPGEDIQCRCYTQPIIDIDRLIAEAEVV